MWPLPFAAYACEARRASRRLVAAPGFAAVAVLAIAFAVTPTVIFRLVDRAVLPPLPYPRPQELVAVWRHNDWGNGATSFPKLNLVRERSRTLDVALCTGVKLVLTARCQRSSLHAMAVTPSFFRVLGARMRLGRAFSEEEDRVPLARPVVVISEAFWRRQFEGRGDIIGRQILLNDVAFTVIGVSDASFLGWWGVVRRWLGFECEDAWIPAMMSPVGMVAPAFRNNARVIEEPSVRAWLGVGRMRPGADLRQVRSELGVLGAEVRRIWPDDPVSFEAVPLAEDAVDPKIVQTVSVLEFAGLLVALLGAIDVGGLFLARGLARSRSLALERVLGASRPVLVFGAACEATLVGIAGALVALLLTRGVVALLGQVEPTVVRAPFGMSLDPTAWRMSGASTAWALCIGALAALAGSLVAAWHTTAAEGGAVLRAGGGISGPGLSALRPTRPRGLLVVAEVTFAIALTLPALLLVRSVSRLVAADLGFRVERVSATPLVLPADAYEPRRAAAFVDEALARLRRQPGVARAAWVSTLPLQGTYSGSVQHGGANAETVATIHTVTADAFATLGIPMRRGRDFDVRDSPGAARAVVLSELAAKQLNADIGARVDVGVSGVRGAEVVAVVADVPYDDPVKLPLPAVYLPLAQSPQTEGTFVVQSDRSDVRDLVQGLLGTLDRTLPRVSTAPLQEHVSHALSRFRAAAWLLGAAALVALGLSAAGVYGVLSALVTRSSHEVGIRIALGATSEAIAGQILRTTLALGGIGLALGLALGLVGSGPLESYLFRMGRFDLWALALAALAGAGLALAAAWAPVRRAMRVDPMTALRSE